MLILPILSIIFLTTPIISSLSIYENELIHRRDFYSLATKITLPLLLQQTLTLDYETNRPRTILITGSNSGIGFDAVSKMAQQPCGHTILLACRRMDKAQEAISKINSYPNKATLIPLECDLANLQSIQSCVDWIKSQSLSLDVLCLNAAVARNTNAQEVLRTKQGIELTIGTNHVGHFYLTQGLLPRIKERIVVTASGVHDPDSPGGAQGSKATLGNLQGLEQVANFEMIDGGSFDADKAYKDSKLCNVLFTRQLQKILDTRGSSLKVNCFNPGLIVSTGLFRDQNPIFTKLFDVAATNVFKVGETVDWGGSVLEYMALDKTVGSAGGLYYSSPPGSSKYGEAALGREFTPIQVSVEARDDEKAKKLWDLTERLIQKQI